MSQQPPILTDNYGRIYKLLEPVIMIGAGSNCQVILDEPEVSDLQCELRADDSNWVLWNLDNDLSTNVNGQPVQESQYLHDGDVISIGNTILRFAAGQTAGKEETPIVTVADLSGFRSGGDLQSVVSSSPGVASETAATAAQKKCKTCGKSIYQAAEICPHCGVRQMEAPAVIMKQSRNRTTAAILAILLGSLGAHKFYLGQPGLGLLYLFFFWTYIPGIVGLFEGIYYLTLSDEVFAEKFG